MKKIILFIAIICGLFVFACTDSSSSSSSSESSSTNTSESKCKIPANRELVSNPPDSLLIKSNLEKVISAELYIFSPFEGGDNFLVKLPGVADNGTTSAQLNYIEDLIEDSGTFVKIYKTETDCVVTVDGGGKAYIASIVLNDDTVLAEKLLSINYLKADVATCVNESLISCYSALAGTGVGTETSDEVVSNFLWKPKADKDGKLVVLLNPSNVTIYVDSEKLTNTGASNGRGTTARGKKEGCNYGKPTIKVIDHAGRAIKFPDGTTSYVISDGCKRIEF